MNNERKSFRFYKSYYDVALELSDKERLDFYDAVMKKQFYNIEPNLKGLARFAYISQKHNIDAQVEGYENKMKVSLNQQYIITTKGDIATPSVGGAEGGDEGGNVTPSEQEKEEEKRKYINNISLVSTEAETCAKKILFIKIDDIKEFIQSTQLNPKYAYIAYRFWQLWKIKYPNHKNLNNANIDDWATQVRLIHEVDKQPMKRIVAIVIYLSKQMNNENGFNNFILSKVQTLKALRESTAGGVYRIDAIAQEINDKLDNDSNFRNEVIEANENFNKKFNESH